MTKLGVTLTLPGAIGETDTQLFPSSYPLTWSFSGGGLGRRRILSSVRTPDEVLAARIRAGDETALAEAYRSYAAVVFGVARSTTASRATAEDVVQEVFCALWRHPERFDVGRGSLRAYLCGIAHRRGLDLLRRDARRALREQRSEALEVPADQGSEQPLADLGTVEVIRSALERLPDDQRQVVELAFWQGRTHFEIADELGIPAGTVKSRLRLARVKLVEWLAELAMEPA